MTRFLLITIPSILTFIIFCLIALPKDSLAFTSCTVQGSSFTSGGSMAINASGFQYPNNPYQVVFIDLSSPNAGQSTQGDIFTPTTSSSIPITITVPSLEPGTFDYAVEIHDRVTPVPFSRDIAVCDPRSGVTISNTGSPPITNPSCTFTPAVFNAGESITVLGSNLRPNTTYTIFQSSTRLGAAQSSSTGSLSTSVTSQQSGSSITMFEFGQSTPINCTATTQATTNPGLISGENPCRNDQCVTGLGTIPTTTQAFATKVLSIAIGIAGGIALILMVVGAVRVLTSSGDPQKVAGGREMIVAAVSGLLFITFSILILQFIGIHIFGFTFR